MISHSVIIPAHNKHNKEDANTTGRPVGEELAHDRSR